MDSKRPAQQTGPSANVALVRSIYADWERGDFRAVHWADPKLELVRPDSLSGQVAKGLASTAQDWRDWLGSWEDYRAQADEYRALDDERVLVLGRMTGRGKMSGVIAETPTANVFHVREGRVVRLVLYSHPDHAFADLGLQE